MIELPRAVMVANEQTIPATSIGGGAADGSAAIGIRIVRTPDGHRDALQRLAFVAYLPLVDPPLEGPTVRRECGCGGRSGRVGAFTGTDLRFQLEEVVCGIGVRGVTLHLDRVEDGAAGVLVYVDLDPKLDPGSGGKGPHIAAHDVIGRMAGNQGAAAAAIVSHLRRQHIGDRHIGSRGWPVVPDFKSVSDLSSRRDRLLRRHDHMLGDFQIGLAPRLDGAGRRGSGGGRRCGGRGGRGPVTFNLGEQLGEVVGRVMVGRVALHLSHVVDDVTGVGVYRAVEMQLDREAGRHVAQVTAHDIVRRPAGHFRARRRAVIERKLGRQHVGDDHIVGHAGAMVLDPQQVVAIAARRNRLRQ